jgi:sulfoxide reductase heme-binding subunit YedZ
MKNWGWMVVVVLAILPTIRILGMLHLSPGGTGTPWITMDTPEMPLHGGRHGHPGEALTGARMAVKVTGEWAIRWLVVVLSLTPFTILTGIKSRLYVRQAAGIAAFVYSFLHLLFFWMDKGWLETFREVNFILGLIATLVMVVLAMTSSRKAIRMLRRNWKRMHSLAYAAGILAVLHVVLLKHGDWMPYLVILSVGFILRVNFVKERFLSLRFKSVSVVPT